MENFIPVKLRVYSTSDLAYILGVSVDHVRSLGMGRVGPGSDLSAALRILSLMKRESLDRLIVGRGTLLPWVSQFAVTNPTGFVAIQDAMNGCTVPGNPNEWATLGHAVSDISRMYLFLRRVLSVSAEGRRVIDLISLDRDRWPDPLPSEPPNHPDILELLADYNPSPEADELPDHDGEIGGIP